MANDEWAAGADGSDDEDLPPLPPAADWAAEDDEDDDLPPITADWARAPTPPPLVASTNAVAFKPRDRSTAAPAMHAAASPWSRRGDRDETRGAGRDGDSGGAPRAAPSRAPIHREDSRHFLSTAVDFDQRDGAGWRVKPGAAKRESPSPGTVAAAPSAAAPAPAAEVHYPSRDEQRAAAAKKEELESWKLAREPLTAFFSKAPKGEPYPPTACRELLSSLSETPLAEGRLNPLAKRAFEVVSHAPKPGATPRDAAALEQLVRGVVNPLYHLTTYGVQAADGGVVAATIAEQMHKAAVKLVNAALEILAAGQATRDVVESAKGIVVVREQVTALLGGKGPGGGKGDKDLGARKAKGAGSSSGAGGSWGGDRGDRGAGGYQPAVMTRGGDRGGEWILGRTCPEFS